MIWGRDVDRFAASCWSQSELQYVYVLIQVKFRIQPCRHRGHYLLFYTQVSHSGCVYTHTHTHTDHFLVCFWLMVSSSSGSLCVHSCLHRNPHAKNCVRWLRTPLPDISTAAHLPPIPDPAGLGAGAQHPQLDEQPAEGRTGAELP